MASKTAGAAEYVNPLLESLPVDGAGVTVSLDGAEQTLPLEARQFSSGSVGYFVQTKVIGGKGRKYQLNITATLVNSKPNA